MFLLKEFFSKLFLLKYCLYAIFRYFLQSSVQFKFKKLVFVYKKVKRIVFTILKSYFFLLYERLSGK